MTHPARLKKRKLIREAHKRGLLTPGKRVWLPNGSYSDGLLGYNLVENEFIQAIYDPYKDMLLLVIGSSHMPYYMPIYSGGKWAHLDD